LKTLLRLLLEGTNFEGIFSPREENRSKADKNVIVKKTALRRMFGTVIHAIVF